MLKLPLHCYDEGGRILPPRWLFWLIGLACADWVLLVFSLASRSQTETLLEIFYPDSGMLGVNLLATLPLVAGGVLISQRARLWKRGMIRWVVLVRPLLLTGLLMSVGVALRTEYVMDWAFSAYSSARLALLLAFIYCVFRSRHLRWMTEDWKVPEHTRE
ncbi:DUF2919 family protein [Alteromonas halophila]|uniref:DUF2919 domain-containing protein n=1 Tax=Alteromonas halophila TaxID=516698 RepID=A0A918JMT0_9ALTE|nr:DUF2919 family protein [Alteromonas halophila]GGW87906.1 hypothetical protein GCM10007391_22060 [Alteromonas halophila]